VLSDLHMGAGALPGERCDALEHFFHDHELAALIGRLSRRGVGRGHRSCLVLNGDVFDFVRVVKLPGNSREVAAWGELLERAGVRAPVGVLAAAAAGRFTARERRYGLEAAEHDSVWKLWRIARGHASVFEALARWCQAGYELALVRGNHDVEWAWPGVRRAFLALLEDHGSGPLWRGQVRFRMQSYRQANLHVEHGHGIRWTTAVDGRFTPGRSLKQPFGSFINRYLLNPVERVGHQGHPVPLDRLLRADPLRHWQRLLRHALRALLPLGRHTWRIWHRRARRWWPTRLGNAFGLGLLSLPLLSPDLMAALTLDSASVAAGAALLAVTTPHLGLALLEAMDSVHADNAHRARSLARRIGGRRRAASGSGARVVVLAHSHRTELMGWSDGNQRVVYANPGCWADEAGGGDWYLRFVWCSWDGLAYGRTRVMQLEGRPGRCRTHSKS
jgi:hypothetical protein